MLSVGDATARTVAGGVQPARRQQIGPVLRVGALPFAGGGCNVLASC